MTEEQRKEHSRKISESHKGKPRSEEAKHKIREAVSGEKNPFYGKHHTYESRCKNSEAQKGKWIGDKNPRARKIICIETLQMFTTIKEAIEWCGSGSIKAHLRGKTKSAGRHPETGEKLHWMLYEDWLKLQEEQQNNDNLDSTTNVA